MVIGKRQLMHFFWHLNDKLKLQQSHFQTMRRKTGMVLDQDGRLEKDCDIVVNENPDSPFTIYPNPATNQLTLYSSQQ